VSHLSVSESQSESETSQREKANDIQQVDVRSLWLRRCLFIMSFVYVFLPLRCDQMNWAWLLDSVRGRLCREEEEEHKQEKGESKIHTAHTSGGLILWIDKNDGHFDVDGENIINDSFNYTSSHFSHFRTLRTFAFVGKQSFE